MSESAWTFRELVAAVEAELSRNYEATENGQIRAVPDERTVRYYITLGLLDPPLAMRGRSAVYGERHLAQLIAIKRLQTQGRSLADIQALLPTLDDATLSRVAGVRLPGVSRARRADFWKVSALTAPEVSAKTVRTLPEDAEPKFDVAVTVTLAQGVSVSFAPVRTPTEADAAALARAAAPLLAELNRRQLIIGAAAPEPKPRSVKSRGKLP